MLALVKRTQKIAQPIAAAYAEANMTSVVQVSRPGDLVFNNITGFAQEDAASELYNGPGRVYEVTGPITMALGDEPQYFSSTFISIPLSASLPRVDDIVKVVEHADPHLVGRYFRVQDVEGGGQIPTCYRMQVMGIQPSKQWVDPR